jgi:hypothetical protein
MSSENEEKKDVVSSTPKSEIVIWQWKRIEMNQKINQSDRNPLVVSLKQICSNHLQK